MNWNAGGWIGTQLGGSLWILVAGVLALSQDLQAGITSIALFAVANVTGAFLWQRREQLSPHAGFQLLLVTLGVASAGAVYVLDRAGVFEAIQVGGTVSARSMYVLLVVVIAPLMLSFYLRFGRK